MLTDALSCPFCGSVPTEYEWISDTDGDRIRVYCTECDTAGPSGENLNVAIDRWNFISNLSKRIDKLEKERDWLAQALEYEKCCTPNELKEIPAFCLDHSCKDCGLSSKSAWIQAAMENTYVSV